MKTDDALRQNCNRSHVKAIRTACPFQLRASKTRNARMTRAAQGQEMTQRGGDNAMAVRRARALYCLIERQRWTASARAVMAMAEAAAAATKAAGCRRIGSPVFARLAGFWAFASEAVCSGKAVLVEVSIWLEEVLVDPGAGLDTCPGSGLGSGARTASNSAPRWCSR